MGRQAPTEAALGPAVSIGADLSKVFEPKEQVALTLSMWASDLYSVQFVCGDVDEGGR